MQGEEAGPTTARMGEEGGEGRRVGGERAGVGGERRGRGWGQGPDPGRASGSGASADAGVVGECRGRVRRGGATGESGDLGGKRRDEAGRVRILG